MTRSKAKFFERDKIFEDISTVAGDAITLALGLKDEVQDFLKTRLEEKIQALNLITREEFDVVKKMAEKARLENEALRKEVERLKTAARRVPAKPRKKSSRA